MLRTLAELIREGSQGTLQAYRTFVDQHGCMCVWGTYRFAERGLPNALGILDVVISMRPNEISFTLAAIRCPDCAAFGYMPIQVLTHLNDTHHWTRERIADWLDQMFIQPFVDVPEERPWLRSA